MSDLAFTVIVFVYVVALAVITYFKTIPSSRLFRLLQKPEWMAVVALPLISVLFGSIVFGVHLPNDIFYFLVLTIFLLPLVFCPI